MRQIRVDQAERDQNKDRRQRKNGDLFREGGFRIVRFVKPLGCLRLLSKGGVNVLDRSFDLRRS